MDFKMEWARLIKEHYELNWSTNATIKHWSQGPIQELPFDFCVLEFKPTESRDMWTYATCGMCQPNDKVKIELHLFSETQNDSLVELLTVIAHYHRNSILLDLNQSVNFGRPWLPNSSCDHGFISLPYLDGPDLEWFSCPGKNNIRFLWLIPVTKKEVEFKKLKGAEALEDAFEKARFDYTDPMRKSVF